jgi:hypothetical protein
MNGRSSPGPPFRGFATCPYINGGLCCWVKVLPWCYHLMGLDGLRRSGPTLLVGFPAFEFARIT